MDHHTKQQNLMPSRVKLLPLSFVKDNPWPLYMPMVKHILLLQLTDWASRLMPNLVNYAFYPWLALGALKFFSKYSTHSR